MKTFAGWLADQMQRAKLSQSEVARRANLNQAAVSRLLSGRTAPTAETIKALAKALKLPPEEVFRAAGLLPANPQNDDLLDRIQHLYSTLQDPGNKQRAVDFLEFLASQEEKGQRQNDVPKNTQPETS